VFVSQRQALAHCEKRVHHPDAKDDRREYLIDRPEFPTGTFSQRDTQDQHGAPETDTHESPGNVVEECFQDGLSVSS